MQRVRGKNRAILMSRVSHCLFQEALRRMGKTHESTCLLLIHPEALWMIVIAILPLSSHSSRKMSAVSAVNGPTPGWLHPGFDDEHLKEVIVGSSMDCLQSPLKRRERKTHKKKNKPQMSRNTRPSGASALLILLFSLSLKVQTASASIRAEGLKSSGGTVLALKQFVSPCWLTFNGKTWKWNRGLFSSSTVST